MGPLSYMRSVIDRNVVMQRTIIYIYIYICTHDKWVLATTAWHLLRMRLDERPPIWRVSANIFNKQLRTAEKG